MIEKHRRKIVWYPQDAIGDLTYKPKRFSICEKQIYTQAMRSFDLKSYTANM